MNITTQELHSLINERYMRRGKQIIQERSLVLQHIGPNSISAYAVGTNIYQVTLSHKNNALTGTCTCPAFIEFGPCKHMAATGLARLSPEYQADDIYLEQKEMLENVMKRLSKQSKNKLLDIIMRFVGQNQDVIYILEDELT